MVVEFIEGPLWTFTVIVFLVGVIFRLFSILRLGTKTDLSVARGSGAMGGLRTIFTRSVPKREFGKKSVFITTVGYAFHIGLLVLVFFAAPHIRFIEERILGFGWPAVPFWAFILAAAFAIAGLLFLWLRRILDPVRKKISTADDHISAILVLAVMLSGCMTLQESHDGLRAFHMLTVEMLLIYFPFSRLMHTFTFIFSRAYTGASYARRGVKA